MCSLHGKVVELAMCLPNGCTDNSCPCPKCGKLDFSISRVEGQLKFICFRVSCRYRGATGSNTRGTMAPVVAKKLFTGKLLKLDVYETNYLSNKFNIKRELLGCVRWGQQEQRVYYPQYNIDGRIQGYIARLYPELVVGRAVSGAKAYWKQVLSREPGLSLPNIQMLHTIQEQKSVVLVEDYPSCLRIISQLGLACCCMGGTNLYDSMISTLLTLKVERVTIVLDADAVVKAMKMKRAIALVFPNTTVIPLTGADPKDMSLDELAYTFSEH